MKVGVFLTNQHPPGSDMVSALEDQYVMTRLARDRGWDAVATGQHYLSEGLSQLQLIPFLARLFVNPHATTATIKRQMTLYRAELARLGKPFPRVLPVFKEIFCARDTRAALEMAGPYLAEKYRAYASWGQDAVLPGGETFHQPFESLLRDRFVLGSPEECWEQLRPCWEEVGANYLVLRTHWSGMPLGHALASMRLISDELLPALRRVQARA